MIEIDALALLLWILLLYVCSNGKIQESEETVRYIEKEERFHEFQNLIMLYFLQTPTHLSILQEIHTISSFSQSDAKNNFLYMGLESSTKFLI